MRFAARTSKRNTASQLADQDIIEHNIRRIAAELRESSIDIPGGRRVIPSALAPYEHHRISADESNRIYLPQWLSDHSEDPVLAVIHFSILNSRANRSPSGFCIISKGPPPCSIDKQ